MISKVLLTVFQCQIEVTIKRIHSMLLTGTPKTYSICMTQSKLNRVLS